jgi:hypothetical protein
MTQTKEEILEANYQEFYDATQPGHRYPLWVADEPYVHKAMDLYAEQLTRQKDERIAELLTGLKDLLTEISTEGEVYLEIERNLHHSSKKKLRGLVTRLTNLTKK